MISFSIKGVPRCVRMDNGTENIVVEDLQMAFRWNDTDDMSANKSVIRGSSHSNQVRTYAYIFHFMILSFSANDSSAVLWINYIVKVSLMLL